MDVLFFLLLLLGLDGLDVFLLGLSGYSFDTLKKFFYGGDN